MIPFILYLESNPFQATLQLEEEVPFQEENMRKTKKKQHNNPTNTCWLRYVCADCVSVCCSLYWWMHLCQCVDTWKEKKRDSKPRKKYIKVQPLFSLYIIQNLRGKWNEFEVRILFFFFWIFFWQKKILFPRKEKIVKNLSKNSKCMKIICKKKKNCEKITLAVAFSVVKKVKSWERRERKMCKNVWVV